MDSNLAASVVIRNKNNVWISDRVVTFCHNCHAEFSFFVRKHHCRNCGNIFCYACASKTIVIPDFVVDKPNAADYWNISYYITSLKGPEEKVCNQCYQQINNKKIAHNKIIDIFNNPVSIDQIKEMPSTEADVKNHYLDHLRNIQYYLPNHQYSEIDKKLLKTNALHFAHHSKYLVHLIKSIDWKYFTQEDLELITKILQGEKIKTCMDLFCTRTCQDFFSCDDCINILYSRMMELPDPLLKYIFEIIMKTPEQVIICHLSFFITAIKNNSTNKLLQSLLFELLHKSKKLIYHTYWFLNNSKETSNIQEILNINNFIELFDSELVKQMGQEYMFFVGLIDRLDDPKHYLLTTFDRYKPISLPYEPNIKLVSVDVANISNKTSYTKPVVIPFEIDTGEKINLLFKKESIMNDVIVLNLMTLCDIILEDTLNTNFNVVVYPTMPLSANSGMIEIIDKAETVHSINNKKKTIFQYIIEKNENQKIGDIMDRYMYSLVSYTLHSYFLGLGDRHLQNIMITEDGAIFHIDFGFILGADAYPLTSTNIKLNSGMLDVIGGSDSTRYNTYLDLCAKGVTILRKYFNIFFILLNQNNRFTEKHVQKFVLSRFQPRQVDRVVICELMTIIKHSHDAYSDYIRDFLHYHTQEKTVQNGVGKVIKTALGAVKSLTASN